MANSSKMTTGTNPRRLQFGVDKFITHFGNQYAGEGDKIFNKVKAEKGFYEVVQLAGMGLAGSKGESDVITYDSIDQDFDARFSIYTYEKSARFTMESMEDDVYESLVPKIGSELAKAHKYNQDYQMARVLNNCTTTNGPDGSPLLSTSHRIQAGGTSTNRLSPDLNLSEDAVEQMVILVDGFLNPDGIQSMCKGKYLVVPPALKFVADRIYGSKYRTSTGDNDVNAVMNRGEIEGYISWKRLSSATTWFLTTDAPDGLIYADRKGITTNSFNDPYSYDQIITSHCRFTAFFADWRGCAGTVGV